MFLAVEFFHIIKNNFHIQGKTFTLYFIKKILKLEYVSSAYYFSQSSKINDTFLKKMTKIRFDRHCKIS